MIIETEIHTSEIPEMYRRFERLIDSKHWHNKVRLCKDAIKGNPLLDEYLRYENSIAFKLDQLGNLLEKYQKIPIHLIEDRSFYPAVRFAAQILSLIGISSGAEAERLRRRVHGAFRNPADMRGLCLELGAATHFTRRGKVIRWPEMDSTGTFDLLVEDIGNDGLEVECKSISSDKGRRIHQGEAIEFYALLKPRLKPFLDTLNSGLCVVLTLPLRLPSLFKERQQLSKDVAHAVLSGTDSTLSDGTTVRLKDFETHTLDLNILNVSVKKVRSKLNQISGTDNRSAIIIGSKKGGVLAFILQSQQDDSFLQTMFNTLSDAAKRQFSKKRASLLLTSLDGIDSDQLRSVGLQDRTVTEPPTALRVEVSKFLDSQERKHVVGVCFLARDEFIEDGSTIQTGGATYYFHNPQSPYWSEDMKELFGRMGSKA